MRFTSLSAWLAWQETLHPRAIDLRLDRLTRTLDRLGLPRPSVPVITIGGTNGKGSCVALTASIYRAAGYRVGTFTSPHLVRYNERIAVDGVEVSDEALIDAFERIDAARADDTLTYFEFNTLAAFLVFDAAGLDLIVLEVGMGGRLDSVNVIDPDVAIVASVALDHCEWLGSDLESIGREKAGIFRPARPAIYGSRQMPASIESTAAGLEAQLVRLGRDFDFERTADKWTWKCGSERLDQLPAPALVGDIQYENAATVLTAVHALQNRVPVSREAIERGLREVELAGRFQIFPGPVPWILDVAHNPAAAGTLARRLRASAAAGRTIAICGMLADKDSEGVIDAVKHCIDAWIPTNVSSARALSAEALGQAIGEKGGAVLAVAENVVAACDRAASIAHPGDRVIVFGSFTTVGPALEWLTRRSGYLRP